MRHRPPLFATPSHPTSSYSTSSLLVLALILASSSIAQGFSLAEEEARAIEEGGVPILDEDVLTSSVPKGFYQGIQDYEGKRAFRIVFILFNIMH